MKDEFIRKSITDALSPLLSLSLSLSPLPLKSNHTAHHSHTSEHLSTCSSSWDLLNYPWRDHVSSPGSLHAGQQTPGWQSSSPRTSASSPSVNIQLLLLCIGSRVTVAFDSLSGSWEMTLSAEQAESYQIQCFSWIRLPAEAWKWDLQPPTMSCVLFPMSLAWLSHNGNCPSLLLCSPNTRGFSLNFFIFRHILSSGASLRF